MLNKYGIKIKKYLQEEYPVRYEELIMNGTIEEKILEKQQEIMEYKEKITEQLKQQNPLQNEQDYLKKVQYERQIQMQVEEMLQEMIYQPL